MKTGKIILGELFDMQMENLRAAGQKNIIERFVKIKEKKKKKAMRNGIDSNHIPFLPVIPRTKVDDEAGRIMRMIDRYNFLSIAPRLDVNINDLMRLTGHDSKKLYTAENYIITDVIDTPTRPYVIFDIEDGISTLGKHVRDVEKMISDSKKRGLTLAEGFALCTHTNILFDKRREGIGCLGSAGPDMSDGGNLLKKTVPFLSRVKKKGKDEIIIKFIIKDDSYLTFPCYGYDEWGHSTPSCRFSIIKT